MTDVEWDPDKMRTKLAKLFRSIEMLASELPAQALASPNAPDFPGGDALHMLAPAASIAVWEAGYEQVEEAERFDDKTGQDRWLRRNTDKPTSNWRDPAVYQSNTEEQPLNVLESWTRIIREERKQPTGLQATVSRELAYLSASLDWMTATNELKEPAWPAVFEVKTELKTLERRMEDVLRAGIRTTRIKAECMQCSDHPRLSLRHGSSPERDFWQCPNKECRTVYDKDGVARCWRQMFVRRGDPPEWLKVSDAASATARSRHTIHSWIREGKVTSKTEGPHTYVLWEEVRLVDAKQKRRSVHRSRA